MAAITQKFNTSFDYKAPDAFVMNLPEFPLESKIEIHSTNDPQLPYEIRFTRLKELSEVNSRIRSLFVDVLLENHTKQSFECILGDDRGGPAPMLMTRKNQPFVTERVRVNRDHTDRVTVSKIKNYSSNIESTLSLLESDESNGCCARAAAFLNECWNTFSSWIGNLISRILAYFSSP